MPNVEVEPGVSLHCYVTDFLWPWQRSVPVVLQHGFSRNGLFWTRWIPPLCSEHRTYRPDVRGFGKSSVPPEGYVYTEEGLVHDIVSILDHFALDKVHWVGESSGGRLGLLMAKHARERLASLVLLDTPAYSSASNQRVNAVDTEHGGAAMRRYGLSEWNRRTMGNRIDLSKASPELIEWSNSQVDQVSTQAAAAYTDFLEQLDLSPVLPTVSVPTLLIAGERSAIAGDQQATMAANIPGARLHIVKDLGHSVSLLATDECVREAQALWSTVQNEAAPIGARARKPR